MAPQHPLDHKHFKGKEHHLDNKRTRLPDAIPNTLHSQDIVEFLHQYYELSNNPVGA